MDQETIEICKKCIYCEKVYFYNKETNQYDKEMLTCRYQYNDCPHQKHW